jgi:hypothetical protein
MGGEVNVGCFNGGHIQRAAKKETDKLLNIVREMLFYRLHINLSGY